MMLPFAFLLCFGLGFKVFFDPRWPPPDQFQFSPFWQQFRFSWDSGNCFSSWTFPFYTPMGNFGWDNVWVDCPWQTIRTNPPTHTLKEEWPHEHILICSQGLKFYCHSITLWLLDICWFLWLTDLGQDKLESDSAPCGVYENRREISYTELQKKFYLDG